MCVDFIILRTGGQQFIGAVGLGVVECESVELKFRPCVDEISSWQGVLLLIILSGSDSSSTFNPDAGVSRTKAYLIFILSFAAITNSVVCIPCSPGWMRTQSWITAPRRLNLISADEDIHRVTRRILQRVYHYSNM
jgi:hypothetical protein